MNKNFLVLVLTMSLISCKKELKIPSTGEIVHLSTIGHYGDSVQLKRINFQNWEVEENVHTFKDTLYIHYAQDTLSGKINHVTIEKKIGIIQ